jgi:hypothetical protein
MSVLNIYTTGCTLQGLSCVSTLISRFWRWWLQRLLSSGIWIVEVYKNSGGTCRIYLQSRRVRQASSQQVAHSSKMTWCHDLADRTLRTFASPEFITWNWSWQVLEMKYYSILPWCTKVILMYRNKNLFQKQPFYIKVGQLATFIIATTAMTSWHYSTWNTSAISCSDATALIDPAGVACGLTVNASLPTEKQHHLERWLDTIAGS